MSVAVQPVQAGDAAALDWVAQGMRDTLVEVEGQAQAEALHDMAWLRDRALSHVDGRLAPSAVWVARQGADIVGHCIVRREVDEVGPLGLYSTTYVLPAHRRAGVAQALHAAAEDWFSAQGLQRRATWTSVTNRPLIRLYERRGYRVAAEHTHAQTGTRMVQLMAAPSFPPEPERAPT